MIHRLFGTSIYMCMCLLLIYIFDVLFNCAGVLGLEQFQLGHDHGGSQDHSRIM